MLFSELAIINKDNMNTFIHVFWYMMSCIFIRYIPKSGELLVRVCGYLASADITKQLCLMNATMYIPQQSIKAQVGHTLTIPGIVSHSHGNYCDAVN